MSGLRCAVYLLLFVVGILLADYPAHGQTAQPGDPMVEPFPTATPPARDLDPICIEGDSSGQCNAWLAFENPGLPSCEECETASPPCDQCSEYVPGILGGVWIIRGATNSGGGTGRSGIRSGIGTSGGAQDGGGGGGARSGSSDVGGDGDYHEDLMRNGTNQKSSCPVLVSEGIKLEADTDLIVPLPGRDFVLSRHFSGGSTLGQAYPWYVGRGWGLSVDGWVVYKPHCLDPNDSCAEQFDGFSLVPQNPLPSTVEITMFPLSESSTFVYDGVESGFSADKLGEGADDQLSVYKPLGPGLARVFGRTMRPYTMYVSVAEPPEGDPPYACNYEECFGCISPGGCFCAPLTETVRVWILDEPGKGETVFLREAEEGSALNALKGRILEKRDAFGNVARFYYKQWRQQGAAPGTLTLPRLDRIVFNGSDVTTGSAWIEFEWNLTTDRNQAPGRGGGGHLHAIRAFRCATPQGQSQQQPTLLGYARYQYKGIGLSQLAELRSVEHGIPVRLPREGEAPNQIAMPAWDELLTTPSSDWFHQTFRTYVYNADSRIVATYEPQQVEVYAERWATGVSPFNLFNAAWDLGERATTNINQTAGAAGTPTLAELASKRVVYYTDTDPASVGYLSSDLKGMVKTEHIRSGCSCGGSSSDRRIEYAYERQVLMSPPIEVPGHPLITFRTERTQLLTTSREYLDGASTPHKTVRSWSEERVMFDRSGVTPPDGEGVTSQVVVHMALRAPFILANEVEDANGRKWRTFHHFKHHDPDDNDFKEHNRDRLHHPSSVASFITAGGGDNLLDYGYEDDPQIAVGFEPGGFVEWTVFDHLGRETEVWATRQQASTPPPASISNFTGTKRLVKRLSYHEPAQINPMGASGTADRPDLVTTVESYRGRDGLSTEANFERTEHEYLVVDAGDSLRGRVKVATSTSYREDVNGPGADVPATTWTGMTDRGDVLWTVDPVGMLTLHTYADRSGALLSTKRNADQAGVPFPTGWTPSPLASAQGGWTADTLTTTRINDSLGRPLRITAEDGTSQVFRYGMEKITYPQSELPVVPDTRLKYFTMWSYPHDLDGLGGANAADGPLVKQWADASMNTIRASKFVVQTFPPAINQAEDGAALGASGTELSRVVHAYATSGALVSTKTRPQVNLYTSPSTFVPRSANTNPVMANDHLSKRAQDRGMFLRKRHPVYYVRDVMWRDSSPAISCMHATLYHGWGIGWPTPETGYSAVALNLKTAPIWMPDAACILTGILAKQLLEQSTITIPPIRVEFPYDAVVDPHDGLGERFAGRDLTPDSLLQTEYLTPLADSSNFETLDVRQVRAHKSHRDIEQFSDRKSMQVSDERFGDREFTYSRRMIEQHGVVNNHGFWMTRQAFDVIRPYVENNEYFVVLEF